MSPRSNTKDYDRAYYEAHREKLLAERRRKYAENKEFREKQKARSIASNKRRRAKLRAERLLNPEEKTRKRPNLGKWFRLKVRGEEIKVKMFGIGSLAARMDRKTKTLQFWERDGVLPEAMFRDSANRRMYTEDQLEALTDAYNEAVRESNPKRPHRHVLRDKFFTVWKTMPQGVKE